MIKIIIISLFILLSFYQTTAFWSDHNIFIITNWKLIQKDSCPIRYHEYVFGENWSVCLVDIATSDKNNFFKVKSSNVKIRKYQNSSSTIIKTVTSWDFVQVIHERKWWFYVWFKWNIYWWIQSKNLTPYVENWYFNYSMDDNWDAVMNSWKGCHDWYYEAEIDSSLSHQCLPELSIKTYNNMLYTREWAYIYKQPEKTNFLLKDKIKTSRAFKILFDMSWSWWYWWQYIDEDWKLASWWISTQDF